MCVSWFPSCRPQEEERNFCVSLQFKTESKRVRILCVWVLLLVEISREKENESFCLLRVCILFSLFSYISSLLCQNRIEYIYSLFQSVITKSQSCFNRFQNNLLLFQFPASVSSLLPYFLASLFISDGKNYHSALSWIVIYNFVQCFINSKSAPVIKT